MLLNKQSLVLCLVAFMNYVNAQVKITPGPVIEHSSDLPLYDFSGCDEGGFCIYRVTTKDDQVERYNRQSLLPDATFKIDKGQNARSAEVAEVVYAQEKIFIFRLERKKDDNFTYFMQTCAADGHTLAPELEIFTFNCKYDSPYLLVKPSPTGARLLAKVDYSQVKDENLCELMVINTANSKKESSVRFPKMILQSDHIYPDDDGNIYFTQIETSEKPSADEKRRNKDEGKIYRLTLYSFAAGKLSPQTLNLPFTDEYVLFDSRCCKKDRKFLIVGGFYRKDKVIDKKTTESTYGIYSFKVDVTTNTIVQKSNKILDPGYVTSLGITGKDQHSIKLDNILLAGNDMYFTGEQYYGTWEAAANAKGMTYYRFECKYYDGVIAKLNEDLQFTWVKSIPMRFTNINTYGRLYKQFIPVVTDKNLYVFTLDLKKNAKLYALGQYDPADLKPAMNNLRDNFVCYILSLKDGSVKDRQVLIANEKELAVFDMGYYGLNEKAHELIIPGDCKEKDRFIKITFD